MNSERESSRFFDETKLADMPKLPSMCAGKHFKNNDFFSEKNIIVTLFSDFEVKNSLFAAQIFAKDVKNWNLGDGKNSMKKDSLEEDTFFTFHGFSEENLICKETLRLSGRHSTCPADHSEGQFSGRNKSFSASELWARILWVPGETKLAVGKTAFHVSSEEL